jgi:hypothetical protein
VHAEVAEDSDPGPDDDAADDEEVAS